MNGFTNRSKDDHFKHQSNDETKETQSNELNRSDKLVDEIKLVQKGEGRRDQNQEIKDEPDKDESNKDEIQMEETKEIIKRNRMLTFELLTKLLLAFVSLNLVFFISICICANRKTTNPTLRTVTTHVKFENYDNSLKFDQLDV